MNEIEKLYENAGVEAKNKCKSSQCIVTNPHPDWCNKCESLSKAYPPFTAEKQLELIKLLMEQEDFSWIIAQRGKNTEYAFYVGYEYSSKGFKEFTEALAGIINNLWQDLTEEEKEQVRRILE